MPSASNPKRRLVGQLLLPSFDKTPEDSYNKDMFAPYPNLFKQDLFPEIFVFSYTLIFGAMS
jgi:hypothetical protein